MDFRLNERNMNSNLINENASLSVKNAMVNKTPRKLPFSDQTNKTDGILRSAFKVKSVIKSESSRSLLEKQSTSKAVTEDEASILSNDDFDLLETFTFPPDKNCYCCGENRKTDGEVWGERLALPDDFFDSINSYPMQVDESEPFSFPELIKIELTAREENSTGLRVCELQPIELPEFDPDTFDGSCSLTPKYFYPSDIDSNKAFYCVESDEEDYDVPSPDSPFGFDGDNSILHDW